MLFKRKKNVTQGNEENIIQAIFANQKTGTYIDVGAHHPIQLSNTYCLYQRGWNGLCLDPNTEYNAEFKKLRPRDIHLNIAASDKNGEADFHLGEYDVHSSLSHAASRHVETVKVQTERLENTISSNDFPKHVDLVSVDTEGTEIDVLEGLNLDVHRPRIIVAEYNTAGEINLELQPYLVQNGYHILYVNCWNFIATSNFEEDHQIYTPDS